MPKKRTLTRRAFLASAGVVAGGVVIDTFFIEPHWLEVVERRLPIANLPADLNGLRLAQLSDLHIGPQVDDDYLLDTFARVNALRPDLVVYTGDFVSYRTWILPQLQRIFARLPLGRLGTFGIPGNHDYGLNWNQGEVAQLVVDLAERTGIRMLRNAVAESHGLHVVGLDDLWAGRFNPTSTLAKLPAGAASIVLSHNPDTADKPGWGDYRGWILSGHTHGGQCKPPFLPPPLLPVQNRRYSAGEFELSGGRRLYVNRGVGHLLGVRFNARPEVTLFRLERV